MSASARPEPVPRRARTYWRTRGVLARLPRGVPSLVTAAWLGVLRPVDVHAIDALWYGRELERYGNERYVRSGLFDWEQEAVDAHFPCGGRVLVAAAGAGREMVALHRAGHAVVGFECSPGLRARATAPFAAEGVPGAVLEAEHDRCPPLEGRFDAVVVGWSAYMFVPTRGRRIAFLRALRAVARPGAPVLLSFRVRPGTGLRDRAVAAVANVLRGVRGAEPALPGDGLEPFFVHRFVREELTGELAAAGFALVAFDAERGVAVGRAAEAGAAGVSAAEADTAGFRTAEADPAGVRAAAPPGDA